MQLRSTPRTEYVRKRVGDGLRELRVSRDCTQQEVAWSAGISVAALSNYESARRDIPLPTLLALAEVYAVPAVSLVPELCGPKFRYCILRQNSLPVPQNGG